MKNIFTLFTIWVMTIGFARAQSQTPSMAVLTEARRVAQIMNIDCSAAPTLISREISNKTGHIIWDLTWQDYTGINDKDVNIIVDEDLLLAIKYWNYTEFKASRQLKSNGATESVTQNEALSTGHSLLSQIMPITGDWRASANRRVLGTEEVNYWSIMERPWFDNLRIQPGFFSLYINPYNGKVASWSYSNEFSLVSTSSVVLSQTQARNIAKSAFQSYYGPILLPGDSLEPFNSELAWGYVGGNSILCRIRYLFSFTLSAIDGSNQPETATNGVSRPQMVIWAEVDAQTGELWSISNVVGAGNRMMKKGKAVTLGRYPPPSPRMAAFHRLERTGQVRPLLEALLSGTPTTARVPGIGASRFTVPGTGKTRWTFEFNREHGHLMFSCNGGTWSGIRLDKEKSTLFARWLEKRKQPVAPDD
jgi:hypothetical protein